MQNSTFEELKFKPDLTKEEPVQNTNVVVSLQEQLSRTSKAESLPDPITQSYFDILPWDMEARLHVHKLIETFLSKKNKIPFYQKFLDRDIENIHYEDILVFATELLNVSTKNHRNSIHYDSYALAFDLDAPPNTRCGIFNNSFIRIVEEIAKYFELSELNKRFKLIYTGLRYSQEYPSETSHGYITLVSMDQGKLLITPIDPYHVTIRSENGEVLYKKLLEDLDHSKVRSGDSLWTITEIMFNLRLTLLNIRNLENFSKMIDYYFGFPLRSLEDYAILQALPEITYKYFERKSKLIEHLERINIIEIGGLRKLMEIFQRDLGEKQKRMQQNDYHVDVRKKIEKEITELIEKIEEKDAEIKRKEEELSIETKRLIDVEDKLKDQLRRSMDILLLELEHRLSDEHNSSDIVSEIIQIALNIFSLLSAIDEYKLEEFYIFKHKFYELLVKLSSKGELKLDWTNVYLKSMRLRISSDPIFRTPIDSNLIGPKSVGKVELKDVAYLIEKIFG